MKADNRQMEKPFLAVTGITGKSGKYFLREVVKHEKMFLNAWGGIRYVTREKEKADKIKEVTQNTQICMEPVIGSLYERETIEDLCRDCNALLHIAGIRYSKEIVSAAIEAGVKRIILVHTTGIYSKYKAAGEEYRKIDAFVKKCCKENEIALTILRPTMIYGTINDGNVSIFIRMVDRLPVMPTVNGAHYELQPVYCRDLGIAYYKVLMTEKTYNRDYNLSGGAPIELRHMFEVIAENLGIKRKYISCPYPIAYMGAWILYVLSMRKMDCREKVQRLVEPRVYDHEDASRDFAYNPVNFEEGVVREVQEYVRKTRQ